MAITGASKTYLVLATAFAAALLSGAPSATAAPTSEARHRSLVVSDPLPADTWPLDQIGAQAAWLTLPSLGEPVTVAVVDAGVNIDHEDLVNQLWTNPADPVDGVDNDGNGVVDDSHGISILGGELSSDLGDADGHGTNVAGVIAAQPNNGVGLAGVAPTAKLMVVKVLGADGSGQEGDIVAGIQYAIEHGARIINLSLGINSDALSEKLAALITYAEQHDVLLVAAAGNSNSNDDTSPVYPASSPSPAVISVAATDKNGDKASFSNWGHSTVELAAPGSRITSTSRDGLYSERIGTSMSAPFVSGVAALLMAQNPRLTGAQVRSAILSGVRHSPAWSGLTITGGILDVGGALTAASAMPLAAPANFDPPSLGSGIHRVGEPWPCLPGNWNAPTSSFQFSWTMGPLVLSTGPTFVPTKAQLGMQLKCTVTGRNSEGVASTVTSDPWFVSPALPRLDSVSITPNAYVGTVARCVARGEGTQNSATWAIDDLVYDYGLTLKIPESAAGHVLTCKTRLTNSLSEVSNSMFVTATVTWPKPQLSGKAKIVGNKSGKSLRCAIAWSYATKKTFNWVRDRKAVSVKGPVMKTSRRDRGHKFTCSSTATGPGGSASAAAKPVKLA